MVIVRVNHGRPARAWNYRDRPCTLPARPHGESGHGPAALGRGRGARAPVRRPLARPGAALGAAGARPGHRRGGRPGRLRGGARPLGPAARPGQGPRLPARRPWSTAPGRRCGTAAVVDRHARRESQTSAAPGADEAALARDRRTAVLEALQALPRRQREVLALRHYLDLSEAEIADALGISRGSVKTHASRGAAALRRPPGRSRPVTDDDLRSLLDDAVADVEPADRLRRSARARTSASRVPGPAVHRAALPPSPPRPWWWGASCWAATSPAPAPRTSRRWRPLRRTGRCLLPGQHADGPAALPLVRAGRTTTRSPPRWAWLSAARATLTTALPWATARSRVVPSRRGHRGRPVARRRPRGIVGPHRGRRRAGGAAGRLHRPGRRRPTGCPCASCATAFPVDVVLGVDTCTRSPGRRPSRRSPW